MSSPVEWGINRTEHGAVRIETRQTPSTGPGLQQTMSAVALIKEEPLASGPHDKTNNLVTFGAHSTRKRIEKENQERREGSSGNSGSSLK